MAIRRDGQDPSGYIGLNPSINPPNIIAERDPTTNDRRYKLGTEWINKSTNEVWKLTSVVAGSANWQVLGSPTLAVEGLDGDTGSAAPAAGVITIAGTDAQGIDTSASGSTVTITAKDASETQKGVIEIATDAEALAETATDKALVPSNLAALTATTTQRGILETATDGEADAATATDKILTPSNLAALTATNLAALTATDADVLAGTSTSTYVTPASIENLRASTNITFHSSPLLTTAANTAGAATGATGDTNLMTLQEGEIMEQFILGAGQTIIGPRMTSAGLLVSLDLADNEGAEYNWGVLNNNKHSYTIGTSAAFFLEWRFTIADVTGADPIYIGFRKKEANNATFDSYTDFAAIGVEESSTSGFITINTNLNSAGASKTDTTDAWADGETHTLRVNVDAAGVVTFLIDGVPPTATAAFTFDNADVVMPFFHGLHGTTDPGAWNWVYVKAGLQ